MGQNILKGIGFFILIYIFWLATGGPERGAERAENGQSGILVETPIRVE